LKIINLTENSRMYTSNVFFVRGSWNKIEDVNTLIDVGRDPAVLKKIAEAPSGVGKKKVDQVILTHSHYDHASLLSQIRKLFNPVVYAASPHYEGVDNILSGGEKLKVGDEICEVISTPGHSSDSICLYCEECGILFAGDTPVFIRSADETYPESFIATLEKFYSWNVKKVYFGHGDPITESCSQLIQASSQNIREAKRKLNET